MEAGRWGKEGGMLHQTLNILQIVSFSVLAYPKSICFLLIFKNIAPLKKELERVNFTTPQYVFGKG